MRISIYAVWLMPLLLTSACMQNDASSTAALEQSLKPLPTEYVGSWLAECAKQPSQKTTNAMTVSADGSGMLTLTQFADGNCQTPIIKTELNFKMIITNTVIGPPKIDLINWLQSNTAMTPLHADGVAYLQRTEKKCDGKAWTIGVRGDESCHQPPPFFDIRSVQGETMLWGAADATHDKKTPTRRPTALSYQLIYVRQSP